jgi:hypothetical protein
MSADAPARRVAAESVVLEAAAAPSPARPRSQYSVWNVK